MLTMHRVTILTVIPLFQGEIPNIYEQKTVLSLAQQYFCCWWLTEMINVNQFWDQNGIKSIIFCVFCFQARIAFLQGERKGQENLKKDLVRRIKMLEYALKQERWVYKFFSFYLTWKTLQTKSSITLCKFSLLDGSTVTLYKLSLCLVIFT